VTSKLHDIIETNLKAYMFYQIKEVATNYNS